MSDKTCKQCGRDALDGQAALDEAKEWAERELKQAAHIAELEFALRKVDEIRKELETFGPIRRSSDDAWDKVSDMVAKLKAPCLVVYR